MLDEPFSSLWTNKHRNQISTTTWVSYGSNVWLLHITKKRENTMNNVINDKYNKNDILLCFKNYTLLGGSSHCTLHTSDLQKNILRLFTKYHSLQLYNTAMQDCIPLSHTHTYAAQVFTAHLQQGRREVTIYHQTKRFGIAWIHL